MKIAGLTTAEEIPVVAKFYMCVVNEVPDFPGKYEDVATFERYSCAAVESLFELACHDLFPLLQNMPIMLIGIYNSMDEDGAGAYYMYGESDAKEGRYFFQVQAPFIRYSLGKFWDIEQSFSAELAYSPHHEIIHMLDDREVNRFTQFYDSIDSREFLISYFSHYRKEGLAGLYGFLKSAEDRVTMEEARTGFLKDLLDLKAKVWRDPVKFEDIDTRIFTAVAYSAGPWMMMHALYASAEDDQKNLIVDIIIALKQGVEISHEDILFLIKEGLNLDLETYISALGKTNWSSTSIIDSGVLKHFAHTLCHINDARGYSERDEARQSAHQDFISVFNQIWM